MWINNYKSIQLKTKINTCGNRIQNKRWKNVETHVFISCLYFQMYLFTHLFIFIFLFTNASHHWLIDHPNFGRDRSSRSDSWFRSSLGALSSQTGTRTSRCVPSASAASEEDLFPPEKKPAWFCRIIVEKEQFLRQKNVRQKLIVPLKPLTSLCPTGLLGHRLTGRKLVQPSIWKVWCAFAWSLPGSLEPSVVLLAPSDWIENIRERRVLSASRFSWSKKRRARTKQRVAGWTPTGGGSPPCSRTSFSQETFKDHQSFQTYWTYSRKKLRTDLTSTLWFWYKYGGTFCRFFFGLTADVPSAPYLMETVQSGAALPPPIRDGELPCRMKKAAASSLLVPQRPPLGTLGTRLTSCTAPIQTLPTEPQNQSPHLPAVPTHRSVCMSTHYVVFINVRNVPKYN